VIPTPPWLPLACLLLGQWFSTRHQACTVLATFFEFRKLLYSCTEGRCHSSTRPGMSLHVISFTRPSPALVMQAINAGVRRPEFEAIAYHQSSHAISTYYMVSMTTYRPNVTAYLPLSA